MVRRNMLSRRIPKKNRIVVRNQDPSLYATPLKSVSERIPRHIRNPRVTRTIRLVQVLTSATPNLSFSYANLASQDAVDYGLGTPRYNNMRVQSVRVWLESPSGLSVSVTPFGVTLLESSTGYTITDRGLTGAQYSKTGFTFSFATRSALVSTVSTTTVFNIATDTTIPASTNLPFTVDVTVEFV